MSEQTVQVADASPSTKNMRTIQQTAGGNTVQSEVVILATGAANGGDTYDARQIRTLTSADIVTAILQNGTFRPANQSATSTDSVLEVKLVALGGTTLTGSSVPTTLISCSTVNVTQSTNPWTVAGNTGLGNAAPGSALAVLPAEDNNGTIQYIPLSTLGFVFSPALPVIFSPTDIGTLNVSQNLLGSNDRPDITVNQSTTLKTSNSNIPVLSIDQYGNLNTVNRTFSQTVKGTWGPGWGVFTGW